MTNTVNPTKVVTGLARLSYANIWQAKSINGGAPKFSTSVLIPKSDTVTVTKITRCSTRKSNSCTVRIGCAQSTRNRRERG